MDAKVRARVSSKGQVTIPKTIREALSLREASILEFELMDGGVLLRPAGGGFLARFGTVKPKRPNVGWQNEEEETMKAVARRAIERAR